MHAKQETKCYSNVGHYQPEDHNRLLGGATTKSLVHLENLA